HARMPSGPHPSPLPEGEGTPPQPRAAPGGGPAGGAQLPLEEAAWAVYRLAIASMVRVVRAVSSERGRDPRRFALVAFGGNGPVHGAAVAAELGIRQVIVPPHAGLFSAWGLLRAAVGHHFGGTAAARARVGSVARAPGGRSDLPTVAAAPHPASVRRAYFGTAHGWLDTAAVDRASVPADAMAGPLIVDEYDATTLVPPGWTVRRDAA